ncbi:Uncharacterised protein [Mycobacterium tuberculosis]|nr:Uncharacterised protein [Mycobacterium tuberculosis]
MVADGDVLDAWADRLHDAGALVAEDPREHQFRQGVLEVNVGVAEPRRDDPDEDFVVARTVELHVLKREVVALLVDNRHGGLH